MYPGNAMASALCSCKATFSRCAPGARPTQQYLRPSRAPATWSLRTSTSWTTTAGDRVLGMAPLVSTRRTPPPQASNRPGSSEQGQTNTKELSFNVTSPADYNNFMQKFVLRMREKLKDRNNHYVDFVDPATGNVVAQIARLPPQVNAPDLMNVNLTLLRAGEKKEVTLSVRTDNLYVIGFRNGDDRWFELRHDRAPMIQGSTKLQFDGRYDRGGIGELSGDLLGREAVEEAIYGLFRYGRNYNDVDQLKGFLRVLIVNFIESVKFHTIDLLVAGQMCNPPEDDAQQQLETFLIRNWGGLSHALMQAVNNPALSECYLRSFNRGGIQNLVDVGRELGMALVSTGTVGAIGGRGGLTLAEVVLVQVVISNRDRLRLDGKITVTDGFGALQLYDDHTQSGCYPRRPISGADDFVIDVNLDHEAGRLEQVAVWNPREALFGDYNMILKGQVTGDYGDVEVQYAVLTDAVVAKVEVVVVAVEDVYVYGKVTARTKMAYGEPLQYSLLDTRVRVRQNTAIPLQRKLVSAPLWSRLEVSANLWDHNETGHHEIANNVSVVFTPRLTGTDTSEITGPDGNKVRVAVTWSVSLPHE